MIKNTRSYLLLLAIFLGAFAAKAQPKDNEAIKKMIAAYKLDMRGPYKDIRWYCADGSYAEPKVGCATQNKNNLQRARYKDEVDQLGKTNHVYLGQILAKTGKVEFWDADYR
ncbi:MAG TPA: phosphoenolpyruvate synthase, partial [Bacteroidia bacterium]|nr:phosphoenolpyruvate synthase [Bacteroidia bacterium]